MSEQSHELSLLAQLQALLFIAPEPLSAEQLEHATGSSAKDTQAALSELKTHLISSGLRLSELNGHYRLVTAPEASGVVRRFLQDNNKAELTRAALETLAIVAYRGPITRAGIEQIRGVASETMIRNLLSRGLISEAGSSKEPGRPMNYTISHSFLHHFGLASPQDLPPLQQTGTPGPDNEQSPNEPLSQGAGSED